MTQDGRAEELEPARRRIMEVTYRVLQKYSYGNLAIQHIAGEFENNRTLLHCRYDGKDKLLADFFGYVLTQFLDSLPRGDHTSKEELEMLVDTLLPETLFEEAYRLQLSIPELRVNAPYGEDCHEEYRHADAELTEPLRDVLVHGVEAGEFDVSDPETEARLLLSILTGTRARQLTVFKPDESIKPFRMAIQSHINRISA